MKVVASAAAIVFLLVGISLQAQEQISLTDFESSSLEGELKIHNPETNDIAVLKENILLQNERINILTESVITSNTEAEICRQEFNNIQVLNSLNLKKMTLIMKLEDGILEPTIKISSKMAMFHHIQLYI